MQLPPGWSVDHFGNLRGVDRYKTYNCAVVVGRSLMRVEDAERIARALYFDRDVELKLRREYARIPVQLQGVLVQRVGCRRRSRRHRDDLSEFERP